MPPTPPKPKRAWALVRPSGTIDVDTVAPTRKEAIRCECSAMWGWTVEGVWASHMREGWRAVKVEITEVIDDDSS